MNITDLITIEPGQEGIALILGILLLGFLAFQFKKIEKNFNSDKYAKMQDERIMKKKSSGVDKKWKWQ